MSERNSTIDWRSVSQDLSDAWEIFPAQDSFVLCSVHGALIIGPRPQLVDPDQLLKLLPCYPDSAETRREINRVASGAFNPQRPGWYHALTTYLRQRTSFPASENLLAGLAQDQGFSPLSDKSAVRADLHALRRQFIRLTAHFWHDPKSAISKFERDLHSRDVPDVVRTLRDNPGRYAPALPIGKRTTHVNETLVDLFSKMKLTLGDLK